jgi:hypothetical protein
VRVSVGLAAEDGERARRQAEERRSAQREKKPQSIHFSLTVPATTEPGNTANG